MSWTCPVCGETNASSMAKCTCDYIQFSEEELKYAANSAKETVVADKSIPKNHHDEETVSKADDHLWLRQMQDLRKWFKIYLICWLGGAGLIIVGAGMNAGIISKLMVVPGFLLVAASLPTYVICIVHSYHITKALHQAGLIGPRRPQYGNMPDKLPQLMNFGPWYIVGAAFILNPLVLGFTIPWSVSRGAEIVASEVGCSS